MIKADSRVAARNTNFERNDFPIPGKSHARAFALAERE